MREQWRLIPCTLILVTSVTATDSAGASCLHTTPETKYEQASLVLAGLPLSLEHIPLDDPRHIGYAPNLATLRVTTVWKGTIGDTVHFVTELGRFEKGQVYIFYLNEPTPAFALKLSQSFGRTPFMHYACSGGGPAKYLLWERYWLHDATDHRSGPRVKKLRVRDLLNALSSSDRTVRFRAGEALGSIEARAEVLPALRRMLVGHQRGDPLSAAQAIGRMRAAGRSAEPELAWAMLHSTGEVRAAALRSLLDVAKPDSFPHYFRLALSDTSNLLLQEACGMVDGRANSDAVGRRMIELTRHPVPGVRAHAVRAVGGFRRFRDSTLAVVDSLRKHDPDRFVRACARGSWGELTGLDPWEGLPKGSRGAMDNQRHR